MTGDALGAAEALLRARRVSEAEHAYRSLLAEAPDNAEALHQLGLLLHQQGRNTEAESLLRRALAQNERAAAYHDTLSHILQAAGKLPGALSAARRAVMLRPDAALLHVNLGLLLKASGKLEAAVQCYRRAVALEPGHHVAHNNLGSALLGLGRGEEALAAFQQALAIKPDFAAAYSNLGGVLRQRGDLEAAEAACRRAVALDPASAELEVNLAAVLQARGRNAEALAALARAQALKPGLAEAELSEAGLLLLTGDFRAGWAKFEARRRTGKPPPAPPARRWQGEALAGKTILLQCEERLADTLLFARYVPLVAARGGRVVVEVPPALKRLAQSLASAVAVVATGETPPPIDFWSPLGSLPRLFGSDLDSIPRGAPYLAPEPEAVERWRARLGAASGLKAGLVWASEAGRHAAPAALLQPLLQIAGVSWFNLQGPPPEGRVSDLAPELGDLAEAAAVIVNLDLVVTIDGVLAHLAGALGRPVWLLLPAVPDWRWLLGREDSPWYPTMRLFRAGEDRNWRQLIERLRAALARRAAEGDSGFDAAREMARGITTYDAGEYDAAALIFERIVALDPANAAGWFRLGVARRASGDAEAALDALRRSLLLAPQAAEAHYSHGNALMMLERFEEAAASYRRAIALQPDFALAHNNLGSALEQLGRLDEAMARYRQAAALKPDYADAVANIGSVFHSQGHYEEALAASRRAAVLNPQSADAHWNEALALLALGDFEEGLEKHEWRWRIRQSVKRDLPGPPWQGEDLAGKTILLFAEQGFGDTIQFLRYVPLVAARGARVVVEVPWRMVRLAQSVAGAAAIVAQGATLPAYDCHCPLMTLPLRFGTRLETIPAVIPYLAADPGAIAAWRQSLAGEAGRKIGLVWAGSPRHRRDATRSLPVELLAPLLDLRATRWYSLQVGDRAPDVARLPAGRVVDLSSSLPDFAETAAVLASLDLVIGVDTAVLHLAGALGRPGWLLLPYAGDWRWLIGRDDSPWYPSLRLFRQRAVGDWAEVVGRVRQTLAAR